MKLIKVEQNYMGRLKYTLELDNGSTYELGGETIADVIYKGKEIEVADDVDMGMAVYYELSEDDDIDGNLVYDVYRHHFVEGYNGLEIGESELLGTWKREKTALKHFNNYNRGF